MEFNMEQYFCVICREILINPVTLPCKHTSCEVCLEKTLECNRYQCFLCRKFIGSWYRNSKRRNQLVNESLQKDINSKFPDLVIKKLNGESIDLLPTCTTRVSSPGEIKEEFEIFMQKMKNEFKIEQEKEDKLSEEFIKQLQEEEMQQKKEEEELLKTDELIARELSTELNSISLRRDAELARKLAADETISVPLSSTVGSKKTPVNRLMNPSPKMEKLRRNSHSSVKVGPMDRFLIERRKK